MINNNVIPIEDFFGTGTTPAIINFGGFPPLPRLKLHSPAAGNQHLKKYNYAELSFCSHGLFALARNKRGCLQTAGYGMRFCEGGR